MQQFWKRVSKVFAIMMVMVLVLCVFVACDDEEPVSTTGPSDHVHTEVVVAGKAATCTETGLTEGKKCSECGEVLVKQETVPALGHTEAVLNGKAPTCTDYGLTDGKKCTVCNTIIEEQKVIEALGHVEVFTEKKEPTCTSDGLVAGSYCSRCETVLTAQATIPALGHTEVIDAGRAATCEAEGLTEGKHCSVCETVLVAQETIAKTGHSVVRMPSRSATCTSAGLTAGEKCSVCNTVLKAQKRLPALGHNEVTIPGKAATCTSAGLTDGSYCSRCSTTITAQREIPKGAHHVVAIGEAKAPTCVVDGITAGEKCDICNTVLKAQEVIKATGSHTPVATPAKPATCLEPGHTAGSICSVCDTILEGTTKIEQFAHDTNGPEIAALAATCTVDGHDVGKTCSMCGAISVAPAVIKATGHTEVIIEGVAAKCNATGLSEGKKCSVCDLALVPQIVIQGTEHEWDKAAVTCTEGRECKNCHLVESALKHEYETISKTTATCTDAGVETFKCKTCEASYYTVIEQPKGHTPSDAVEDTKLVEGSTCEHQQYVKCQSCSATIPGGTFFRHTYSSKILKPATCVEVGKMEFSCTKCSEGPLHTYQADIDIDKENGHEWQAKTTRTSTGTITYNCAHEGCDATKTVVDHSTEIEAEIQGETFDEADNVQLQDAEFALTKSLRDSLKSEEALTLAAQKFEDKNHTGIDLSDEDKNAVSGPVFNFTLKNDEKDLFTIDDAEDNESSGKGITVTVPYTPEAGEDVNNIVVYYLDGTGEGTPTPVKATYFEKDGKGYVSFTVTHFSHYGIGLMDPKLACTFYNRHEYEEVTYSPTCLTVGMTFKACKYCADVLEDSIVVTEATGHTWDGGVVTEAATCTKSGRITYTCTTCPFLIKTQYNETIPMLEHSYKLVESKKADCQNTGSAKYACEHGCGAEYEQIIPKGVHTYGEGVVTAPTCEKDGFTTYTCVVEGCDNSYAVVGEAATGHKTGDLVVGETQHYYECSVCGTKINAIDHKYTVTSQKLPTCEEDGIDYGACSCGKKIETVVNKLGHQYIYDIENGKSVWTWKADKDSASATLTYICQHDASHKKVVDAAITTVADQYVAPTCETAGNITYLATVEADGTAYTAETSVVLEKLGHKYGAWKKDPDKTPTEEKEGRLISICENDNSHVEEIILPVLNKTDYAYKVVLEALCEEDGEETYTYTTKDGAKFIYEVVIPELGHKYGAWQKGTLPTKDAAGTLVRTCEHDKSHVDTVEIPALNSENYNYINVPATCEKDGLDTYVYEHDGATFTYEIVLKAFGHTYGDWALVEKPTSDKTGLIVKTCETDPEHTVSLTLPVLTPNANGYAYTTTTTCESAGIGTYTYTKDNEKLIEWSVKENATGHSYGEYVVVTAPTPTTEGLATKTCEACRDVVPVTLPVLVSDTTAYATEVIKAPTCTVEGTMKYTIVIEQGTEFEKEFSFTAPIAVLGHKAGEWKLEKEPTETEKGLLYRVCERCGENRETQELPMLTVGSTYEYNELKAPTCETKGEGQYSYTADGNPFTFKVEIPALGHAYGEWTTVTAPTKEAEGTIQRVCANDKDHVETFNVPVLGSTAYKFENTATCTEDGEVIYTYTKDGQKIEYSFFAAKLGHALGETVIGTMPNFEREGDATRTCTRCNTVKEYVLPVLNEKDYRHTVITAPTCTEGGKDEYLYKGTGTDVIITINVKPLGHSFGEWRMSQTPSVETTGILERACANCNAGETHIVPALSAATEGYTYQEFASYGRYIYLYGGQTFNIDVVTVTFVDYDGAVLDRQTILKDKPAKAPATPERDGYVFLGWDSGFDNVTANITVKAVYEQLVTENIATFTGANVTTTAGTTDVVYEVTLKNDPGFLGMGFTLHFDTSVFTLSSKINGSYASDCGFSFTAGGSVVDDQINFIWVANEVSEESNAEGGVVLKLKFKVSADAAPGTYEIGITAYERGQCTVDGKTLYTPVEFVSGTITVE